MQSSQAPTLAPTFNFNSIPVRAAIIDGKPWFVAKDVCECLGIVNHKNALSRLRGHKKGVCFMDPLVKEHKKGVGFSDPLFMNPLDGHEIGVKTFYTNGGPQELAIINEPGLYRLIFTSNKPEAEAFQDWVYHVVLPEINRTGGYGRQTISNADLVALVQAEVQRALQQQGALQQQCIKPVARRQDGNDLVTQFIRENIELNQEYDKREVWRALRDHCRRCGLNAHFKQRAATHWMMNYALSNDLIYSTRRSHGRDFFRLSRPSLEGCVQ